MSITILLKKREVREVVQLPLGLVKQLLNSDSSKLLDALKVQLDTPQHIHDREWLRSIVNYVPTTIGPDGAQRPTPVPITEMQPWLVLAARVNALPDDAELIRLSKAQYDLIWGRITSQDFKLVGVAPLFFEFLLDFAKGDGRHFSGLSEELAYGGEPDKVA